MELNISKCPRCGRIFSRIYSPVCGSCVPLEDADYERIHEVLERVTGLTAAQTAEEAGVELGCINRMLETGLVARADIDSATKCGRCGAKAISASKRLCQACLTQMDLECAHAIREMRERMGVMHQASKHDVHNAVESKRARAENRRAAAVGGGSPITTGWGSRMAVPQRRERRAAGRS